MKLENQVSTYEQGLRLKELGVNHGSIFYWFKNENLEGEFIDLGILYNPSEESISAYTVAELGVMLPDDGLIIHNKQTSCAMSYRVSKTHEQKGMYCVEIEDDDIMSGNVLVDFTANTEAEARAAMLIYLLENNHTTPEEVNTRLNNQ